MNDITTFKDFLDLIAKGVIETSITALGIWIIFGFPPLVVAGIWQWIRSK